MGRKGKQLLVSLMDLISDGSATERGQGAITLLPQLMDYRARALANKSSTFLTHLTLLSVIGARRNSQLNCNSFTLGPYSSSCLYGE